MVHLEAYGSESHQIDLTAMKRLDKSNSLWHKPPVMQHSRSISIGR